MIRRDRRGQTASARAGWAKAWVSVVRLQPCPAEHREVCAEGAAPFYPTGESPGRPNACLARGGLRPAKLESTCELGRDARQSRERAMLSCSAAKCARPRRDGRRPRRTRRCRATTAAVRGVPLRLRIDESPSAAIGGACRSECPRGCRGASGGHYRQVGQPGVPGNLDHLGGTLGTETSPSTRSVLTPAARRLAASVRLRRPA